MSYFLVQFIIFDTSCHDNSHKKYMGIFSPIFRYIWPGGFNDGVWVISYRALKTWFIKNSSTLQSDGKVEDLPSGKSHPTVLDSIYTRVEKLRIWSDGHVYTHLAWKVLSIPITLIAGWYSYMQHEFFFQQNQSNQLLSTATLMWATCFVTEKSLSKSFIE